MVKSKRRRRYAAPIGGLFLTLAFIGLAALVAASISLTSRVLDNSREKTKIEDIIRPVLMFDPVPFESAADIDPTQLLYYCMWYALLNPKASNSVNDEMLIPASDLDAAAVALFGPDLVRLEHKTFGEYETSYYYDQDRQRYQVPVSARLYVYSPRVENIEKSGDNFNVRVAYIPPSGTSTIGAQGNKGQQQPDKYMVYVMKRTGDTYQIVAVRDDVTASLETHLPTAGS